MVLQAQASGRVGRRRGFEGPNHTDSALRLFRLSMGLGNAEAAEAEAAEARRCLAALPPSEAREALLELCFRAVHRSS